jgi:Lamin Tail Domain/Calx-beta domain
MKRFLLLFLILSSGISYAQLTTGDIAFVGYNADGNDNIAFVALTTINSGEVIIFEDNEWNGTAFIDTNEGAFSWTATLTVVAGTIVLIDNIGSGTITASTGTVVDASTLSPSRGTNRGISGGDEVIYAYQGSASAPTFITAVASGGFSVANGALPANLTEGTNAISFQSLDDDADIAIYNAARNNQISIAAYRTPINTPSNWIAQDGTGDQSIDLIAPDVPFSTASFSVSSGDTTPPTVTNVSLVSATSIEVTFSESVTSPTATSLSNYTISGSATISSITYNDGTRKATLTTSTLTDGIGYTITASNIADQSANIMPSTFTSSTLIFNSTTPALVITEIMYNAKNVPEADVLEFIEIYNTTSSVVQAGGLKIKDGGNFDFTLPEVAIPANGFLLLATDKTGAELFYTGKTFIDLPVTGNVLSNGGELIELRNSLNQVIDGLTYDDVAPWPTDADEKGYSLQLYKTDFDNSIGSNWGVASEVVGTLSGTTIFASPGSFTAVASPISFATESITVQESVGNVTINLSIAFSDLASESTMEVAVVGGTGVVTTDYTFATQNVVFPANDATARSISFTVVDNAAATQDKYVVLALRNPVNASLGAIKKFIVFIKDNDRAPIAPSNALTVNYTSNYKVLESGSSAEISAYDPSSKRLFVVNSLLNKMEILDLTNPSAITRISTINMTPYGAGLNSIAVKNGIVAVAVENVAEAIGKVAFFNTDGVHQVSVDAGNLPDMVTFSPDGKYVLTANEAQPIFYTPTLNDPEGSITIVDISAGIANLTQANVTQVNFNAFDSQLAALKSQGVRIFGPGSSVSQDLEPEYITISADSKKAYVTLQENNALAVINLETKAVTNIFPLGYKDHLLAENSFDASDVSGEVFFGTWKVKGMYNPDAIAYFESAGNAYVITANEGDARVYTGLNEETTFASLNLDATAFPDADILKNNSALGRLTVTNAYGDTDNDGDFDEVYVYGARSFTIWNAATGAKVFDSGNQLERITAEDATWGPFFNANNSTGTPAKKNRSDNKGPEPEGVAVASINGKQYAFIALERIGGVATYDITNPAAPVFVSYDNNRSNPVTATNDFGAEGILYISAKDSPNGTALVVLSNEISATVSVYTLEGIVNVETPVATAATARSSAGFTANWNAVSGASGYQLDVSTDNFATFVAGYNAKAISSTSEIVSGLNTNATYQYRVRAVSGINVSENSSTIVAVTLPTAPVATAFSNLTGVSFTANWNAVTGATGYRLDVSDDEFVTFVAGFENKAVTGTSAAVTGLTDGTSYAYRLRAEAGENTSANSNVIEVIITGVEEQPSLQFEVYPNPATGELFFVTPLDFELLTLTGTRVKSGKKQLSVRIGDLNEGLYILKDAQGRSAKIVIKQ